MMNKPVVIWIVVALSIVLVVVATVRGAWVLAVFLYVCTALNAYTAVKASQRVRAERGNKMPTS